MKIKHKQFTRRDYDEVIFTARRLCNAIWCENKYLAKFYKQDMLRIAEIDYDYASSLNPVPEPRWCTLGYQHCAKLWFVYGCINHGSARYAKSELYALAKRFVDWLYDECERDPSQDLGGYTLSELGPITYDFDVVKQSVKH